MISGSISLQLLEWVLGSQPETEAVIHHILATIPVVSDKGPGSSTLQERISTKT